MKRSLVLLCELPKGQGGRPSKAFTLPKAESVLIAAGGRPCVYFVDMTEFRRRFVYSHPQDRQPNPRDRQDQLRKRAGHNWHDNDLVFASRTGTALNPGNVRRAFRKIAGTAGLKAFDWTPRELRHSFVSLMSDAGVPIEKVARLVGHTGTTTTETVYRKQIRPVVTGGAEIMDQLFPQHDTDA